MHDRLRGLWLAHDGPVPPADFAAACWGAGAAERLARGAQGSLAETRLRARLGALARLGRADRAAPGMIARLCGGVRLQRCEALEARR